MKAIFIGNGKLLCKAFGIKLCLLATILGARKFFKSHFSMHFTVCFSSAALSLETAWLKLHPDTNDSGQGRRNIFSSWSTLE